MSKQRQRTVLRAMAVGGVVVCLAGVVLVVVARGWSGMLGSVTPYALVVSLGIGAIVWPASAEQPGNRLLWILVVSSVGSVYGLEEGIRLLLDPAGPIRTAVNETVPASMPPGLAWFHAVSIAISSASSTLLTGFAVLLFPDGRLPSRRWRPVALFMAAGIVVAMVFAVAHWHPANLIVPDEQATFQIGSLLQTAGTLLALAGLLSRYRRVSATERSRIKWVLWGLGVFLVVTFLGFQTGSPPVTITGFGVLFAAYGIGIVRHNLFDVNVVISRTLTYAVLAAVIGAIYVGVVVGIGSLLGSGDEPNPVLAIGATALVSVAFQPARLRLQRLANRLVFGRRATPYEVLSDFSRRVAVTSDSLLVDAARSLVDATRARRVTVIVNVGASSLEAFQTVEAAAWPPVDPVDGQRDEALSAGLEITSVPIVDGDAHLGSLELHLPPGESLLDDERRLVDQLAAGMSLALSNQALTERLAARIEELRESRRRLVAVQDDTRRRLERDLHDGVQQQLVALKVKLGLCRGLAETADDPALRDQLAKMVGQADEAVESLREFARGVYPPLLEAEGLEAAIGARLRRSAIPIEIGAEGLGRYPQEVESSVYFCVLEALGAVGDRRTPTPVRVQLSQRNGSLTFEVRDRGVTADRLSPGVISSAALQRIGDRLDALSGTLHISCDPDDGTILSGVVPVGGTR